MDPEINYKHIPDSIVWKDFKRGCRSAYCFIYKEYSPSLYNYGRHLSQDEELIKDCIQDLFVEVWIRKERLGDVNSIKSYLFQSLRRKIVNALIIQNKHVKNNYLPESQDFELIFPHEFHLINDQITEARKESLLKAINTLTKRQKEAIFLKYYDNLTYKEVASVMSLNINSTYNIMSKAIDVLKKNIRKVDTFLKICG